MMAWSKLLLIFHCGFYAFTAVSKGCLELPLLLLFFAKRLMLSIRSLGHINMFFGYAREQSKVFG